MVLKVCSTVLRWTIIALWAACQFCIASMMPSCSILFPYLALIALGTKDPSALPSQFSIVKSMTGKMPPLFVTAGNADLRLPHSKILVETARKLGVTADALFFPADYTPPLQHEYEFDPDAEAGKTALQHSLKFCRPSAVNAPCCSGSKAADAMLAS